MTLEERVSDIEKATSGFNIVTSGVNVQGGFPELKPKNTLEDRIGHLEDIHKNFTIRGGANVTVEGSLQHGFAICSTCPKESGTGNVTPGGSTPPPTGACCVGEDCTIETEDDCTGMGGTYQGDDTDCDPNPCGTACNGCFYEGFLGENNYKFQTINYERTEDCTGDPTFLDLTASTSSTITYFSDPDSSCSSTCISSSGTSSCTGDNCPSCSLPDEACGLTLESDCLTWAGTCENFGNDCFGLFDGCGGTYDDDIISDSVRVITQTCDICSGSIVTTITLSGICSDA